MNSTWVQFLLNLGQAGASIAFPGFAPIISTAIAAAESLISTISASKASGQSIAAPVFLTVLQATFAVMEATGKLTPAQAIALSKAITDTLAADKAAQLTVDPTSLPDIPLIP